MSTSPTTALPNAETAAAWKQEVNERLVAHRTRRTRRPDEHPTLPGLDAADTAGPLKSSIAAKVAARYAKAPTYSEMLAAEAQNAAEAAATAARAANDAHAAAQAILTGLDLREDSAHQAFSQPHPAPSGPSTATRHAPQRRAETPKESRQAAPENRSDTRREPWQDALPNPPAPPSRAPQPPAEELRITMAQQESAHHEDDLPPQPISANLIEFPRELVATRRARPRLAEGPLREESSQTSGRPQLRIFEVEADSISTVPSVEHTQTEWSSIRLGAHPHRDSATTHAAEPLASLYSDRTPLSNPLELPLQTASLEDRAMAAIVDLAVVTAAFLAFVLAFAACAPLLPMGRPALVVGAFAYIAIALGYQLLFFAYAESTPGMRYAKIALCTFDDENPTRKQMRTRIATMLLSLCPLGLGCAWVFFDEDHLSWHDRITRTYQRSYR